jgi:hypothetical protein
MCDILCVCVCGFYGVKCKNDSCLRSRLWEGEVSYNSKFTIRGKQKEHKNVYRDFNKCFTIQ